MIKDYITKEAILKYVDDYNIFRFYCGNFQIGKKFLSPIKPEKNPSFAIFVGKSGELCFRDFRIGSGDFPKLIQLMYNLNYFEALSKIAHDFNINDRFICKNINNKTERVNFKISDKDKAINNAINFSLDKKSRKWKIADFKFWSQFGITYPTLYRYHVSPVDYIFINDFITKADKYAYCFTEFKDDIETYKIYQPFNEEHKWINNHNDSVWQGWTQLPKNGKDLIITKSLKDVMAIHETLKLPAISLQAENIKPKDKVVNKLKSRFEHIIILYDNDFDSKTNWGRQFAENLSKQLDIPYVEIDDSFKSKDYSDLIKNHGIEVAKKELNRLINLHKVPF